MGNFLRRHWLVVLISLVVFLTAVVWLLFANGGPAGDFDYEIR